MVVPWVRLELLLNRDLSVRQVCELIAANVSALRVLHAVLIPRHGAHSDDGAVVNHSIPRGGPFLLIEQLASLAVGRPAASVILQQLASA